MPDRDARLQHLSWLVRWTGARLWLDAVLRRTLVLLPLPLAYAVLALTLIKALRLSLEAQEALLVAGVIPTAILAFGVIMAGLRRRPWCAGALALDRHLGLSDRISTALAFRQLPHTQRTIMMELAMDDAARIDARRLSPRRAAPLRLPAEAALAAGLLVALAGLSVLEVRTERRLAVPSPPHSAQLLGIDDVELFRDRLADARQTSRDPELNDSIARFNQLIEDLARRPMERDEAFRKIAALENRLVEGAIATPEALEEGLKRLADELARSDLSKPVAQDLRRGQLSDAEEALRKLARRLNDDQRPPSAAELESLRKALQQASSSSSRRLEELRQRRQQLQRQRERLLKKKRQQGQSSRQDQQSLVDLDRQLERLDRQKERSLLGKKQLSELDRQLAEAARHVLEQLGLGARDLERAAQDIHRLSGKKMTLAEKQKLLEQLRQLREILRQQGQGGEQLRQQLRQFSQRARGQSSKSGKAQGGQQRKTLVIGPGIDGAPVPASGRQSGTRGSEEGSPSSQNQPGAGQSWGKGQGSDPHGAKTSLPESAQDVTAVAQDSGEGTASSEVIQGAAERGFRGRGYRQVYTEYRSVAEELIERDRIPPGYRFYVQRYFELIRPRQ